MWLAMGFISNPGICSEDRGIRFALAAAFSDDISA
jgi:hypothetical protein